MASIFTYDPDPPRVSSPWTASTTASTTSSTPQQQTPPPATIAPATSASARIPAVDYANIRRLEAEPQEGPTEYKLHLLLRRRRSYTRVSTGRCVSGSLRRSDFPAPVTVNRSVSEYEIRAVTPPSLASTQSRQHRLEQLTTQLLWRLQQSCSYHIASTTAAVLPHLPNDARLSTPDMPPKLLPGLEDSKGALYEIGVADDGTIVGLAEDEMEESLNNLKAMAASLGCGVEVLRRVLVGECEWIDYTDASQPKERKSKLLAIEALVRPSQHLIDNTKNQRVVHNDENFPKDVVEESNSRLEQLRISVTGSTTSGKSSLIGTLSTATLDNGRGSSRLSLLKHRHEIASGMTSSVTQELLGYRDISNHDQAVATQVVSYGSRDVSSWIDIHASVEAAENGRLVLLSDSAGHPRFRRTTVRSIIGWQPHWTLLCIPADNSDDNARSLATPSTTQDLNGNNYTDFDISHAHLHLCLSLELPLVIVITKFDLTSLAGLRSTVSTLLSVLKQAGRKPCIIRDPAASVAEADLHSVSAEDLQQADDTLQALEASPLAVVPIILTSAVKGTGIKKLHAFLRRLPIPSLPAMPLPSLPTSLFYIEDIYSVQTSKSSDRSAIIGGYLRCGTLNVGDEFLLGPYPVDISSDDSDSGSGRPSVRSASMPQSRSFPGALNKPHARNISMHDRHCEWRRVRITSLRNLRLPVRTLHADQIGTMGIAPVDTPIISPAISRIRKGMVLANRQPKASKVITVRFEGGQAREVKGLGIGSAVVVYIASVRASSKVISVTPDLAPAQSSKQEDDDDAFGFGFDDEADEEPGTEETSSTIVTFQFIASREFVEVGAKVLVMPGGGPGLSGGNERGAKGLAGLDGFVGRIIED